MAAEIRLASDADTAAIARVRRASWFAAYSDLIDPVLIDRATTTGGDTADPPPFRTTLVAVAPPAAGSGPPAVVGYAAFGPERAVDSTAPPPGPGVLMSGALTPAGHARQTAEVYALYAAPAWWSTGTGLALMNATLTALRTSGYRRAVLWTLTGNARARRFYDKAGFAPDGAANILAGLGGVEELRYARDL